MPAAFPYALAPPARRRLIRRLLAALTAAGTLHGPLNIAPLVVR